MQNGDILVPVTNTILYYIVEVLSVYFGAMGNVITNCTFIIPVSVSSRTIEIGAHHVIRRGCRERCTESIALITMHSVVVIIIITTTIFIVLSS